MVIALVHAVFAIVWLFWGQAQWPGWVFILLSSLLVFVLVMRLARNLDRKRVQQQRDNRRELERLRRRVGRRTAELEAINTELDAFAYAVSHDLRAPLRAMSGFSHELLEDHGHVLDDDARLCIDQIQAASERMSCLIDAMLALSRLTRGQLERKAVDLSEIATRYLESLARENPDRDVRWSVESDLIAQGDPHMLQSAVVNLIDNAWKYSRDMRPARIEVGTGLLDGIPGFRVTDNGAGFDMAHAKQLFTPFQRLHRDDEFPGIGVGLATVRRIVERHGGHIQANAEVGKGAEFIFTIPPAATSAAVGESQTQSRNDP